MRGSCGLSELALFSKPQQAQARKLSLSSFTEEVLASRPPASPATDPRPLLWQSFPVSSKNSALMPPLLLLQGINYDPETRLEPDGQSLAMCLCPSCKGAWEGEDSAFLLP
jgi:hypothetical protein